MYKYYLDDTTYYVHNDRIYKARDETHDIDEIDDHAVHLYPFRDGPEIPCRLLWGGDIFSRVEVVPVHNDHDHPKEHVHVDDFDGATPMKTVVPEGINECPDCGRWAGKADDPVECFYCGYGLHTE